MSVLTIHVFKDSYAAIAELLDSEEIAWSARKKQQGVITASSEVLEIVLNAGVWGAIATVLIKFIKARHGRRVQITTKNEDVIYAEGLTQKDLEAILQKADRIIAFDPNKSKKVKLPSSFDE